MGPTASGKSAIAIKIAQCFPVEIISVDSAQIYRYMDIGSAKPDQEIQESVPHHLIDLINPYESYSAARFRSDALIAMQAIVARGRIPLLVGGTMMYFKVLSDGLAELPSADKHLRDQLEQTARSEGLLALHSRLKLLDPVTAAGIQPSDSQRIQRALEVCYLTGKPMSVLLAQAQEDKWRSYFPYQVINIALLPSDRTILHDHIAQRFDRMLAMGLVEELSGIRQKFPVTADMPAMRCVGYRQAWCYLDNQINLAKMREMGVIATRQLAKRQLTWLRSMHDIQSFDCLASDLSSQVIDHLAKNLSDEVLC
ncbi:tRNA (adenosine(37)-N6)-dimethylallyltransferase MiaA [Nitrosomonas mobilis]|uniref:tRNA dimethylallyltransferase n=1 Tax=Nitrosomonas mobilis TaxID=51642 RepID=A0A1G5SBN2_9PROT|nr:tRNA (adenosine(37)-N6)-dimethylallyltransferase MiaA [Nitrosomonas mobilis]SCZ84613.1 delta(2)-isopentenylpyrophosphate tRNA-adenosine transferase [Nitrosomonas mobilis]